MIVFRTSRPVWRVPPHDLSIYCNDRLMLGITRHALSVFGFYPIDLRSASFTLRPIHSSIPPKTHKYLFAPLERRTAALLLSYAILQKTIRKVIYLSYKLDTARDAVLQRIAKRQIKHRNPGIRKHEREFSIQNNSLSSYLIRAVFPFAVSMIVKPCSTASATFAFP
jgi:hypothetical protein